MSSFFPEGLRGEIGAVCLQYYGLQGDLFYGFFEFSAVFERYYAAHTDIISHFHILPGHFRRVGVAVDNSSDPTGHDAA